MNEKNNNFFMAIFLCMAVLLGWQYLVVEPKIAAEKARRAALQPAAENLDPLAGPVRVDTLTAPQSAETGLSDPLQATSAADKAFAQSPRLTIKTEKLSGSIALMGARIDDLNLDQLPVTLDEGAAAVRLLNPQSDGNYWQATHGWNTDGAERAYMPGPETVWQVEEGDVLTTRRPVTLKYAAPNGLVFRQRLSIDDNFMFTIEQSVENTGNTVTTLYPYGRITRQGVQQGSQLFVLHEGGIAVLGEEPGLKEIDYDDLVDDAPLDETVTGGWLGLTDKYWATTLVPPQDEVFRGRLAGSDATGVSVYQADFTLRAQVVSPGATARATSQFFAGAKQVGVVDGYRDAGVYKFDLLIDWGWFYFLTKPMFTALAFFYEMFGNYGVAILIVTVLIKLVFFPLANKSYETMAKMKKLQPEMLRIREVHADDRVQQQQEMMKLYREEKLNPLAGCLPILVQVPVFFSLYKVLFVTIDMRHQPFFGWIADLSAPDPTSLFNLFGLIDWTPPQFLMLGVWPLLMGLTMYVQMQMNPPAPDPVQRRIFQFMPIVFTFLLASFPAGLVIYWAWNNFLSVLQQGVIMRRHGAKIELLPNIGLRKKDAPDDGSRKN